LALRARRLAPPEEEEQGGELALSGDLTAIPEVGMELLGSVRAREAILRRAGVLEALV